MAQATTSESSPSKQTSPPAAREPNEPLEADVFYDQDSTYGVRSETTSVLSSIYNYRVANGRTYHSYNSDCKLMPSKLQQVKNQLTSSCLATTYALPNDALENDRQGEGDYLIQLDP